MTIAEATPVIIDPALTLHSDRAYHVTMRDGVRLALNLYFPGHDEPSAPVTVILAQTRYGRATAIRDPRIRALLASGRVVATLDTRGSTASFGTRRTEMAPEQMADIEEVIAHLASRPWSNGKVIAMGTSYLADTADFSTSRPAPELVGAIPMQADFDIYLNLFYPGGVVNTGFILEWGKMVREMDMARALDGSGLDGRLRASDIPALFPQIQAVDNDHDCALAQAALQGKLRWLPQDWLGVSFRDDRGANGFSLFASSPAAHLAGIRQQQVPVQYWGSWMDAGTADSALNRFRSAPDVPTQVWITANDHPNATGNDPFRPHDRTPRPSAAEMLALQLAFVEQVESGAAVGRLVHYLVMGADVFRTTDAWPPADMTETLLHFSGTGTLDAEPAAPAVVAQAIDLTTSTGPASRWTGQQGGVPADYPDRAAADARLMTWDSAPMPIDMELSGFSVVALEMAAQSCDPAVFVYLEDVAPDARVTFITEGQFRCLHRRPADPAGLPYDQGPAPHSFARADMLESSPGERMRVEFALSSTAALIRAGHRLRLALAGADTHMFMTYSDGGPERFEVFCGSGGSTLTVPLRPW